MMRILMTGATGFLGRHLVAVLVGRGDFVVRIIRDHLPVPQPVSDLCETADVRGDVTDVAFMERTIAEYEIAVVVHLAAQTQVSIAVAHPYGTMEANVRGTYSVLDACRRQGVKRIIVAASDKVYGDGVVPYEETQALLPHGIYATSKAVGDMIAQSYAREYGMPICITRCGNLYGPGHVNFSCIIPNAIRCALMGGTFTIHGTQRRDYLYIGDAVDGYVRLLDSCALGAFNFGTGCSTSVLDVLDAVERATKRSIKRSSRETVGSEIYEQYLDCSKAEERLAWVARHNLAAGLDLVVPWYREHFEQSMARGM